MAFQDDYGHRIAVIPFSGENTVIMSQDLTSDIQVIFRDQMFSIQPVWTGGPTGTLKLEGSLDKNNWCLIPSTTSTVNGPSSIIWDLGHSAIPYFRVKYERSGGSGILKVYILVK